MNLRALALIEVMAAGVALANPGVEPGSGALSERPISFSPEVNLGFRYEPGVEARTLFTGIAQLGFGRHASAFAGFSFGAMDNPGIAHYGFGAKVAMFNSVPLGLEAQVNHDEWSDWQIGENRVGAAIFAQPLRDLSLAVGLAYRLPLLSPDQYRSPLIWTSDAAELNYLYRIDWRFLTRRDMSLAAWVANYDRLSIRNPSQFPFGLRGLWGMGTPLKAPERRCWLTARLGTDIKGLSGLLFSLGELDAEVGGVYVF